MARKLEPGPWVLDLACGKGEDARWLLEHGFCVRAVDAFSAMLELLRRKTASWSDRIYVQRANLRLGKPDRGRRHAAALLNFGGLNALPDPRSLLRRLYKALLPGARVLLVGINRWALLDELLSLVRLGRLRRWPRPTGQALVAGQRLPLRYYGLGELKRSCAG